MWVSIFSILFYVLSLLLITPVLLKSQAVNKKICFFATAFFALVLHLASLFPLLAHIVNGEAFTVLEIGSLMSVIIALLATLAIGVNTIWFVLPIVYAFSIVNLVFATFVPSHFIHLWKQDGLMLFHIGLSIFAYAVCFIAFLYAIQIGWIDHYLKVKKMKSAQILPPLLTVERHFFRLFMAGELLLTLTLISGSFHLANALNIENLHKAIFSFLSWLVFAIALFGYWKFGWRGKRMIIYVISGMILLTVAYFASRMIG